MRKFLVAMATACLALLPARAAALPANVEHVETLQGVSQYRLKSNGMTLLLAPNRAAPVVTFMVVYHVGSRNEAPGHTGSAHLLEHLLFNKSTENFGRARGHASFQDVLFEAGADFSSSNMTTWYDRMDGYSTLPSDQLELAMRIEADRLGRGLILDEERQSEMSVVRNEFEIGENNPSRALNKAVLAAAIQAHPYHWNTIGYRSDIEGVTTGQLRVFYKTYFHPDNAEAILAGDFDTEAALALFDRQFGGLARSPAAIPQVITVEPPQEGERRVLVRRPGNLGLVQVAYMRPAASHPDFLPLVVLDTVLAQGVNSRLYQALVNKGLATQVNAYNLALRDPYPLLVSATCAPGVSHEAVEGALRDAVARVAAEGVTDAELRRAQQQIEVDTVKARDGTYPFTRALGEAVASTDWKWFMRYVGGIQAVTAADLKRVAATYLVPERTTVGWFVPVSAAAKPVLPVAPAPSSNPVAAAAPAAAAPREAPAAPAAPRRAASFAERTARKVLANGLVVDVVENRAAPTVSVVGLVAAGQATAAGKPALATLTANLLSRGTATRSKEQIGALLDNVGAERSYGADLTEAGFRASGMARDLPLILEVLSEEIRQPRFAADELAKARKEIEAGYLRADDDTSWRAMERLGQLVYPQGHPYRPAGRAERQASLAALGEQDLRAFHAQHWGGASIVLAIVGDVDARQTLALVERHFGNLPPGERVSLASTPRVAVALQATREMLTMRGKANMNIVIGSASGLRRLDPDHDATLVANAVLGQSSLSSRIGKRVRDTEGLSYSLFSRLLQSDEADGLWLVNVNVAPQNLGKALRSTHDEMQKYARDGATDREVEVQKRFFANNFRVRLGSNAGVAAALATAEKFGFGPQYLDDYPARIAAVTTAQVNEALRKHFMPQRMHLVVSGDRDTLPD